MNDLKINPVQISARLAIEEETNLSGINLSRFEIFDAIERDPRERIITIAYYGFVKIDGVAIIAKDDAKNIKWFSLSSLPILAFDHAEILSDLLKKLNL